MAELVETLTSYTPEAYPHAIRDVADELLEGQPAIAPIVALVNTVFLHLEGPPDAMIEELNDLEQRIAASTGLLSRIAAGLIDQGGAVLTFGGSGSVKQSLIVAGGEKRIFVSCVATMPNGEGLEMAADLAAAGLAVELIPDEEAADALPDHDLALMGASALGPDSAMNLVGAAALASEARATGVPLYVVASAEKALPGPLFARAVAAGAREGRWEPVPLSDVTAVVTEEGVLDPEAASALAAGRVVADRLIDPTA
jgi:translation initiation factor 2B subunit (eIF-2B alpha/beta/delta family)